MSLFERLRPASATAAALAESLERTDAALAAATARVAAFEARRGEALMAGGREAETHEAGLRAARDDAERLAALRDTLRARHEETARAERRAALEAQAAEAERLAQAAADAIRRRYPRLAAEIADLMAAEVAAYDAIRRAHVAIEGAGELGAGIAIPAVPVARYAKPLGNGLLLTPLADLVRLPDRGSEGLGLATMTRWHWPPEARP